ncbi:hypothetical protein Tco_1124781 [Tanacetum coccineum]|uniref:Uncharacterized protein n=1 Tax=Tanacetum coccineum TaxID=301880 RepID=A0ABQ5J741_9ASTR
MQSPLQSLPKISSLHEREHIKKDNGKKEMSSEEADKESTNNDSNDDDETHASSRVLRLVANARTFNSLLLAKVDKRNLNPLKQMRVIEQQIYAAKLKHLVSLLEGLQGRKKIAYVKRNKAISLEKTTSKVGIEVQQLFLKGLYLVIEASCGTEWQGLEGGLNFMSSSPHSTVVPSDSDNENTFSSTNILNYFPASPGNISPNSSDDFTKYLLDILLFPPLHDDPYIQAYDVIPPSQVIIALPAIVPPPMSDSRSFFPPKEISSPEGAKTPVESPNPMSTSSSVGSSSPVRSTTSPPNYLFNESIFAELDNSLWIISRPLGSKPVPEEFNMPPKRTSTSAAPAMTQDAIRQLVADSVAIALKAQAANLANTDNTNKNTGTSGTPVARKGINDHKRKIEDRGNTTTPTTKKQETTIPTQQQ